MDQEGIKLSNAIMRNAHSKKRVAIRLALKTGWNGSVDMTGGIHLTKGIIKGGGIMGADIAKNRLVVEESGWWTFSQGPVDPGERWGLKKSSEIRSNRSDELMDIVKNTKA